MSKRLSAFCLLISGPMVLPALSQSSSHFQVIPLCELQTKVAQGEQGSVLVEGVYLSGIEGQYLVTSGCSGNSTLISFELRTRRLVKQLMRLSNQTNTKKHVSGDGDPVLVVFEETVWTAVSRSKTSRSHSQELPSGMGSNESSTTKMVVRAIQRVQPLPADHPCAPRKSDPQQWPCFQNPASSSGGVALGGSTKVSATSLAHGTAKP